MAHPRKKQERSKSGKSAFGWQTLRLAGIIGVLCLGVIALAAALMQSAAITFGQPADSCTHLTHAVVESDGSTTLWASVRTNANSDVMTAVKCTPMFQNAAQGNDLIARAMQQGHPAAPVLVKPYRRDAGLAQIWIVPIVDQNQLPLALLTFVYDDSARQLRAGEFAAVTGNMFYVTHSFPYLSPNTATATVLAQHHVAMARSSTPELIYFPGDVTGLTSGKHSWQGGGTSFLDPIWRVAGTDGQWHYVGRDGLAHLSKDLPVASDSPAAPASVAMQ